MNKDILEVIKELESKKDIISKQIGLLNNLESKAVNEEEWKAICETPLRYKDVILEIAKATFPNGSNFVRTSNNVNFKMMNFEISIPTSRNYGIEIDISELRHLKYIIELKPKERSALEKLENRYKAFTDRDMNLNDRFDLLKITSNSKIKLFLKYMNKRRSFNKELTLESITRERERLIARAEEEKIAAKDFDMEIEKLRIVVDKLKQFGQVKALFYVDGVFGKYDIEKFLKQDM